MALARRDLRRVLGRLVWAAAVIWIVLTAVYAVMVLLPESRLVSFAETEMGVGAILDVSGGPIDRYLAWMNAFLTLDWGRSLYYGKPVLALYADRVPVTLAYVVPGLLVSLVVGLGVSTYAAIEPQGRLNRALSLVSYLGLGVPAFILAEVAFFYAPLALGWIHFYDPDLGLWHPQTAIRFAIPAAVVALVMAAIQIRHAQSATVERLDEEFVKVLRSKGSGRLRVARHVFRTTWPTMVSVVLGEALGVLVLTTIVIERILEIPGIAVAIFNGFGAGDPMLSFTAAFAMVALGVTGTLLRDVVRYAVDPRVDS